MTLFRSSLLLVATATALLTGGCGPGASDTIKIGEYASLTGKEAGFGQSSHRGTLLAVEEINAAGGVLGRQLQLITEDNQTKPGESATVAKKLISRDRVVALLGEVASGRSLEAAPIAQAARIPMIAPAATNPKVTETGDYIFRVCFIDPFQGTAMAKFALETLNVKRVAIASSVSSAYSVGLAQFFKETFTAGGGTIVAEQKFSEGDKDFRAQLTAIRAAGAEAVFVPAYYTEAALLVRQARELGLTVPVLGGDGWEAPQLLEIGGEALNGCYYSTHFSAEDTSSGAAEFVQRYRSRWNGETPGAFAALGYDSVQVLVEAIRRAGTTDGPAVRDALAGIANFPGATGTTTINAQRDATKPAAIIAIREGRLGFLKSVAP